MPEVLVHRQELALQHEFGAGDILAIYSLVLLARPRPPNLSTDLPNHPNYPIWASCFT